MTADYAALEARVAELERQMRHILPNKIDAVAYGLSVLHDDVRAFREEMGAFREDTQARFDQIDDALAEILRRLPESGPNGHER